MVLEDIEVLLSRLIFSYVKGDKKTMKKEYEKPIVTIEKFDEASKVTTTSELNVNFNDLMEGE